jgi:AraC-like DNA-binding protein
MVKSSIADFSEGLKSMPVDHLSSSVELTGAIKKLTQISNRDFPGEALPSFEEAMGDVERIYRILRVLTSEKAPRGRDHKQDAKIRRIIDVIESLASLPTSLDEIARQSAISKFHLCRIFKRATGMTVQTYLNELRINRACRLLAAGDRNVTEVCFDCGFENLSYFIQVFKGKVGVPPKKWALAEKKKRPRITV